MQPDQKDINQLSIISKKWDVGKKGFLTKTEQYMREMDAEGAGALNVEQLASFMGMYDALEASNKKTQRTVWALGITTALLCIGTIITAVVATKASQPVRIGEYNQMMAKGTNRPVVTQAEGVSAIVKLVNSSSGVPLGCLSFSDVAWLYSGFTHATPGRLLFQTGQSDHDDDDPFSSPSVALEGRSSYYNDTHTVIGNVKFDISHENRCNHYATGGEHPHRRRVREILAEEKVSTRDRFKDQIALITGNIGIKSRERLQRRYVALYEGHYRQLWEENPDELQKMLPTGGAAASHRTGSQSQLIKSNIREIFSSHPQLSKIPALHQRALDHGKDPCYDEDLDVMDEGCYDQAAIDFDCYTSNGYNVVTDEECLREWDHVVYGSDNDFPAP